MSNSEVVGTVDGGIRQSWASERPGASGARPRSWLATYARPPCQVEGWDDECLKYGMVPSRTVREIRETYAGALHPCLNRTLLSFTRSAGAEALRNPPSLCGSREPGRNVSRVGSFNLPWWRMHRCGVPELFLRQSVSDKRTLAACLMRAAAHAQGTVASTTGWEEYWTADGRHLGSEKHVPRAGRRTSSL